MTDYQRKYLIDISESIRHIETFIEATPTMPEYVKNLLVRRGVEREFEIMGEAMSQILKTDNPPRIAHARLIVDLRNRVIHGYDTVDDTIIWGIIEHYLPELKLQVNALM